MEYVRDSDAAPARGLPDPLEGLECLPDVEEVLERAHVVSLPMRVRFRGVSTREALVIEGPKGWGEFSPFLDYGAQEAANWLRCGLEMAYVGAPPRLREKIAVNATVPAVAPGEVAAVLERFPGCTTIKVKVAEKGQTLAEDIARVNEVRALCPGAKIRVDANRGWSVPEAVEAAKRLGPLDYLEQPCGSVAELKELRKLLVRAGIFARVAADESIRKAEDPFLVAEQHAADVAVVKAAPLGGPRRVLAVAEFMRSRGLDITVASALDTGVGMNAGLAAVAALPRHEDDDGTNVPPAAAGLGTAQLFVADITPERPIVNGHMDTAPLAPEPARLKEFAAAPDRRDWWYERLRECWQIIAE